MVAGRGLLIALLGTAVAGGVHCEDSAGAFPTWSLEPWAGVTTVDFASVKANWAATYGPWAQNPSPGWDASAKIIVPTQGTSLGMAMGYRVAKSYGIGLRLGLISTPDLTARFMTHGYGEEDIEDRLSIQAIPLLVGGWVDNGNPVGLQYRGSIFLGPMFTTVTDTYKYKLIDHIGSSPPYTWFTDAADSTIVYSGTALDLEIGGSMGWGFSDSIALSLGLALRIAKVGEVKSTSDRDNQSAYFLGAVSKGDAYVDKNDKALPLDFTGVDLRLEVRYSFPTRARGEASPPAVAPVAARVVAPVVVAAVAPVATAEVVPAAAPVVAPMTATVSASSAPTPAASVPAPVIIPPAKVAVAVADLRVQGVPASEAVIIADLLRAGLGKAGIQVMEKASMEKVFAESGFQPAGCSEQECAVKVGKLLNVQRVVVGLLGKLMGTYVINLRLVDVASGGIIYASSANGRAVGDLESGARELAVKIADHAK